MQHCAWGLSATTELPVHKAAFLKCRRWVYRCYQRYCQLCVYVRGYRFHWYVWCNGSHRNDWSFRSDRRLWSSRATWTSWIYWAIGITRITGYERPYAASRLIKRSSVIRHNAKTGDLSDAMQVMLWGILHSHSGVVSSITSAQHISRIYYDSERTKGSFCTLIGSQA